VDNAAISYYYYLINYLFINKIIIYTNHPATPFNATKPNIGLTPLLLEKGKKNLAPSLMNG
jgi:hypothetical protein